MLTLNFKLPKKPWPSINLSFNSLLHVTLSIDSGQYASQKFMHKQMLSPPRLCSTHRMLLFVVFITEKDTLHVHVGSTNKKLKDANLYNKNKNPEIVKTYY